MAKKKSDRARYRVGFDLGGTKMVALVFDEAYQRVARKKNRTDATRDGEALFADIRATIETVVEKAGIDESDLEGIGMGAPGPIDPKTGRIVFAPNLPFENFPMQDRLAEAFGVPAIVDNDVNLGVWAEYHFGAARGRDTVLGVFPGTGIGGGLVIDGKLHHGASGAAGEIGHTLVDTEGPACGCGRRGCLEAICARPAIAARAAVLAMRGDAPKLAAETGTNPADIRSGALKRSIEAGDEAVEAMVRRLARRMARGLSGIFNALSPDTLLLGGGLVEKLPELFIEEMKAGIAESVVPFIAQHIEIRVAELGDDAVAKGAAKLVDLALKS